MDITKMFYKYLEKTGFTSFGPGFMAGGMADLYVVVPCFKEGDITPTLVSLRTAQTHAGIPIHVLIVVNAPESADVSVLQKNKESVQSIQTFISESSQVDGFSLEYMTMENIPDKIAGVGWARKRGFDEIIYRIKDTNSDSVLIWFDADSICAPNFLQRVKTAFDENKKYDAVSIYFEHPIPEEDSDIARAIIDYELHLRIYIHFQAWSGLPFAFQTIGSSMAMRASAYVKSGGMSPKKAGEDFYFLQKMGEKGIVGEVRDTVVYPSCRISDRVPFGTGKAIGDHVMEKKKIATYNPDSYRDIMPLWDHMDLLYSGGWYEVKEMLPDIVRQFCIEQNIEQAILEIKHHSSSFPAFRKRFFQWFNAFRFMKYLHFMRLHVGFEDTDVLSAATTLLHWKYKEKWIPENTRAALHYLREKDKMPVKS